MVIRRRRWWFVVGVTALTVTILSTEQASAGQGGNDDFSPTATSTDTSVVVNASGYELAAGVPAPSAPDPGPATGEHGGVTPSNVVYNVVWRISCTSTSCVEGTSDYTYERCSGRPFNQRNMWYLADVYVSTAGGPIPGDLAQPGACFNLAVVEAIENGETAAPEPPVRVEADDVKQVLAKPKWTMQPAGKALVVKPVIVSVDTPRKAQFNGLKLQGKAVRIRAHVKSYEWDWGDGSPTTATTERGQRYSTGDCEVDACAGYVNHSYESRGNYTIGLTIRWTSQFSVAGGPWQDVPGEVELRAEQAVEVVSADTVLVDPSN